MTIFALSSAPGQSGVAVFRISGPETGNIIKLITNKDLPSPRKAKLLKIPSTYVLSHSFGIVFLCKILFLLVP